MQKFVPTKAPEGGRTPRRSARFVGIGERVSVPECGGPPPLFPGDHFAAALSSAAINPSVVCSFASSIGPETSKAIAAFGLKPTLEAKEHTTEGLITALLKAAAK